MCAGISSLVSGEDSQSSASAGLLYVLVLSTSSIPYDLNHHAVRTR